MRQPKEILLFIALFYFVHSQVAPYLHFHHHDHEHQAEREIIIASTDEPDDCNNKLCCREHHHSHQFLEADWNYISNAKNIKVKVSVDLIALLPKVECRTDRNFQFFEELSNLTTLSRVLPKHFNKAPPVNA